MLPVDTKWLVLGGKQDVTIYTKSRYENKYIHIPQMEVYLNGDCFHLNRLRPIASMCQDLPIKPDMSYKQLVLSKITITCKEWPEMVYHGRVELVKEEGQYHIIYYIDTPATLQQDCNYIISDVFGQYI